MGFDKGMIKKVYLFLKPRNIENAIELMTEINGIYQHDYYESRTSSNINLCYICKKERKFHRDYINEKKISSANNNIVIDASDVPLHEFNGRESKEECLICLESFQLPEGDTLPCDHFCCHNCLFNYLKTEISSMKVTQIKCFVKDCDVILDENYIISKLREDEMLIEKYKLFKQRAEIYLSEDKKFCPEPDCNSYIQRGEDKYVQCRNGHKYCYICLKPWHGENECDEELDKDFQLWKSNKIVKRCPRCKMYTEKNEGCNHMTCAECKFQWCWLCEGEYKEDHYSKGACNGLQFARINSLSERNQQNRRHNNIYENEIFEERDNYYHEAHYNYRDREKGCCLCNHNIIDKLWFIAQNGPISLYYGNSCVHMFVSLFTILFLMVPICTITIFFELPDRHDTVNINPFVRIIAVLFSITQTICYLVPSTCLIIIAIIFTLPFPKTNICKIISEEKDAAGFYY